MRLRFLPIVALLAFVVMPITAGAQYGHPLKGSWSGERTAGNRQTRLLVTLDWDGRELSGVINPGPNAAIVKKATVDASNPSAWTVRLDAERKDPSGERMPIVVVGKLENIGAARRFITGTWTEGRVTGPFKLTRN